jgi:aminopeptidase
VEEVARQLARRGAYALTRIHFVHEVGLADAAWLSAASDELLAELPSIDRFALATMDAVIVIVAPENTREMVLDARRIGIVQAAFRPASERLLSGETPWVGCQYPCPALAQDAGMSLRAFGDFLYGACLLDWDEERRRMERFAARFDAAEEVRIVAEGTDLTLSLAGRTACIDAGSGNMPGGEFFSPVEDSTVGTIAFREFPAVYAGREVVGIRLRLQGGRVVDASAETNEEFLLETLATDEGASRVGELGIGCNPGITRHMKNTLFDEKMDGTVHLALGLGFPLVGGTNVSAIHWDIVKDLRGGGQLLLDGEIVQESGRWLF